MQDFKNPKFILIIVAGLIGIWHLTIAMASKIEISGPFMAKPVAGYTWTKSSNAESHFFWQNTEVRWRSGLLHPEFKAQTTENEGIWHPLPGYYFINKTTGLETTWKAGVLHPDYMAWSAQAEGEWEPVVGYRLIYYNDTIIDSVWEPNQRYDALKVVSLTEKDKYFPFPGYKFISPEQNLDVKWTPGLVNYENSKLIAGQREGTWAINYSPSPATNGNSRLTRAQIFGLGVVVGGVAGYGIGRGRW